MTSRVLAAMSLLATSAAARADAGGAVEGAALSGMLLMAVAAAASFWIAMREREREAPRHSPLRLRVKARRYRQP
jgi:hypothetical protein